MDQENLEYINGLLEQESDLREKLREQVNELDKKARSMLGMINKIHSTPPSKVPALVDAITPVLSSCGEICASIAALVPPNQFWKWNSMWSISLRNAVFTATMVQYLKDGSLMTIEQASEVLGIEPEWKDRFALTAEDYLHALISLVNELSRLAVNSVTMGNFEEPIKISVFVKDIFAGFAMLNLKNDSLRRRYDSLKYDIKKIEEVVYDVSLRKLAHPAESEEPSS